VRERRREGSQDLGELGAEEGRGDVRGDKVEEVDDSGGDVGVGDAARGGDVLG